MMGNGIMAERRVVECGQVVMARVIWENGKMIK